MKGASLDLNEKFFNDIKPRVDSAFGIYEARFYDNFEDPEDCNCYMYKYKFQSFENCKNPYFCKITYSDSGTSPITIEGEITNNKLIWIINGETTNDVHDLIFKLQDILYNKRWCECWSD